MKIRKWLAALLLSLFTVTAFAGCGGNEREQALAPYVGTWVHEFQYSSHRQMKTGTSTFTIQKDEKNPNTLIAIDTVDAARPEKTTHVISYDEKDKTVKLDENKLVMQKDEKGDYFVANTGYYQNAKYYKQK